MKWGSDPTAQYTGEFSAAITYQSDYNQNDLKNLRTTPKRPRDGPLVMGDRLGDVKNTTFHENKTRENEMFCPLESVRILQNPLESIKAEDPHNPSDTHRLPQNP